MCERRVVVFGSGGAAAGQQPGAQGDDGDGGPLGAGEAGAVGLVDAEEALDEAGAAIEGAEEGREVAVVGTPSQQEEQGKDGGGGEQVVQARLVYGLADGAMHGEAVSVLGHT